MTMLIERRMGLPAEKCGRDAVNVRPRDTGRSELPMQPQSTFPYFIVEEWRPIPGYESLYSVSSEGRVRREKAGWNTFPGKILQPKINRDGYVQLVLTKAGHQYSRTMHQLVAAAFIGPCPSGCEVNHKDGLKTNNHPTNLEYVTNLANNEHAVRTGLRGDGKGERNQQARLTRAQALEIRARLASGERGIDLAAEFGVSRSTVSLIHLGRIWGD